MKLQDKKDLLYELELNYIDFYIPGPKINMNYKTKTSTKTKEKLLRELYEKFKDCKACPLSKSRIKFVFGDGNPESQLMIIGEGPGYDEDRSGLPFVGRAGQLLTEIIEKGMKIKRKEIYIGNIVKCHPLKNPYTPEARGNDRPPNPDEMNKCSIILEQQIEIIKPKIILALGTTASQFLTGLDTPISKLRGNWFERNGVKVICAFHPSYLLRYPSNEKDSPKYLMWQDIKKVIAELKTINS